MAEKIILSELAAESKEEETEEVELAAEIKRLAVLKAELAKAQAVIKSKEKDFSTAEE